jgi:hypothetical protein
MPAAAPVTLPPIDPQQRYNIPETALYLRCSRAWVFHLIGEAELRIIRDGRRVYVPGTEIIRRSRLPSRRSRTTPPEGRAA